MSVGALALCAGLAVGVANAQGAAAGRRSPDRFDAVVIDAGHGGDDAGARGDGGLLEKELVLDVSRRLARKLRPHGLRVVETRTEDRFVPLESRTSIANDARGDLFVSIHANSSSSSRPRGIETYFVSLEASDDVAHEVARRENEVFGGAPPGAPRLDPLSAILGDMAVNEHVRESSRFAKLAQQELGAVEPAHSRGVKQAPFVVLMGVRMPAALVEIGFLSNAADERELASASRRRAIADALARAIVSFGEEHDRLRGLHARAAGVPAESVSRGDAQ